MYRQSYIRRRNYIIIGLCLVVLLMAGGFAMFSSQLKIKGTSNISSKFKILITGIEAKDKTSGASDAEGSPSYTDTSASFHTLLVKPGDYYVYLITVENQGSLDGIVKTYGITNSNPTIKITDSGIVQGQVLKAGESTILSIKVEYDDVDEQPENIVSDITVDFEFRQKDVSDSGIAKNKYTVTYNSKTNGGNEDDVIETLNVGDAVNLNREATKEYYDFVGWNTDKDAEEGLESLQMSSDDVVLYAIFKSRDSTPPVIDSFSTTKTPTSITAIATASDSETGITKYEFSLDNGSTWIDNGTNGTYTFTGLTTGQTYNVTVRVTNGVNTKTTSDAILVTTGLQVPTFIEYITSLVTAVEITYPEGCSNGIYTCSYQKNSETAVTADNTNLTDNKISVEFTESGTIIATVSDGTNTVSSTYTISTQAIPITPEIMINKLGQEVVTTGDGLYEDDIDDDDVAYVYRGANPANYIKLGSDLYRIMSIDTSGNLKVIRDTPLLSMVWDPGYSSDISGITSSSSTAGTRYSSTSTDYCYGLASYYYGCKSWGSKTSTLASNGTTNVTQMPWEAGSSTLKTLPTYDSYMNVYLNGGTYPTTSGTTTLTSWYSSNVASTAQGKMIEHLWNVGPVASNSSYTLAQNISQEAAYKWKGKVGLMTTTDYVRASTNSACTNVYNYGYNSSCYSNSSTHNWLDKNSNQWTLAPNSSSSANFVWYAYSYGYFRYDYARTSRDARPVLYLASCISLSGSGENNDEFTIINDSTCTASSSQTIKVSDKSTLAVNSVTTNSISVTATPKSGLTVTKYEFSKDNGSTWTNNGTNSTYTFTGLTHDTDYNIKVRLTTSESKIVSDIKAKTDKLVAPIFSDTNGTNSVDTTITYMLGCGSTYTCSYTKNEEEPVTVSSNTETVNFTLSGTVTATISDGTNTVRETHTPTEAVTLSFSTAKTTNSITVTDTISAPTEVSKYEFQVDGGDWVESANNVYTFTGLSNSTSHTVNSRVTTNFGTVKTGTSSTVTLNSITLPTYSVQYNALDDGNVTITYPSGCGSTYTCTYAKNSENPVTVTSSTAVVNFSADGEVGASVSDGTNTVSNSYTVTMPTDVIDDYGPNMFVVGAGDGLYQDNIVSDDVAYVYRGANPNNYITLGNDLYRIMSIDTDGNIKVIKDMPLLNVIRDAGYNNTINGIKSSGVTEGTRYSSNEGDYCYRSYISNVEGCKSWGSSINTFISDGTTLATQMYLGDGNDTLKNLSSYDSYLNVYLNGGNYPCDTSLESCTSGVETVTSWYSTNVDQSVQNKMISHLWNIGLSSEKPYDYEVTLEQNIEKESEYKWLGMVGLLSVTDYVRGSTNPVCTSVYNYYTNSYCYNHGIPHNWLDKGLDEWTMSPYPSSYPDYGFRIGSYGSLGYHRLSLNYNARPVFYLSSNIILSGEGTSGSPFTIIG